MAITAALVKELRERTSAGMMECKKALVETNGDLEAAIEHLRKTGMAKADKKADRTAADGLIIIRISDDQKLAVMVEVNCETDFVAKDENFQNFANEVGDLTLANQPADLDALLAMKMNSGDNVSDSTKALTAKIGEKMEVRRFTLLKASDGAFSSYSHGSRIGVVVELSGNDVALAKDIAMHIAASKPVCVSSDEVPAELIEKEKEIFAAQAAESGKPAEIVEKMVSGRINKYLKEVTLLGQPFVKDPDSTVEKLLKSANAAVNQFTRFEIGEGVEKKQENFADEVMAQVKGS
ncbi:MAG: translation elongation factor Ts [Gammaproteobacteria bacterium]|nr:translation elongation factor Ts [Gammaproteobacteria bacterium]MDH5802797.1 translation elongation factor Ts [Gammaproteobacteria bacterium]